MVGFNIMNEFNVDKVLHCSKKTLQMWLSGIAGKYRNNPYHSQVHAADVLQATSCLLRNEKLKVCFLDFFYEICINLFVCDTEMVR